MTQESLEYLLRQSYSLETCYPSDRKFWSLEHPGVGHCGVTALVVLKFLGGEILETKYNKGRAFHNRLPNGSVVDLTGEGNHLVQGVTRTRDPRELLHGHTKDRYLLLLSRVLSLLPIESS
jgi:hypothetical protein